MSASEEKKMKAKIDPEILNIIEQEIKGTVQGVRKLLSSGLNRRTIVLLIQDAAPMVNRKKLGTTEIKAVLEGMESLERVHIKKKDKS